MNPKNKVIRIDDYKKRKILKQKTELKEKIKKRLKEGEE